MESERCSSGTWWAHGLGRAAGGGEAERSPSRASATFSAVVVLPVPGVPVMSTFGSFLDALSAIFAMLSIAERR